MALVHKRKGSPYWYVTKTRESTSTANRKQAEEYARKALTKHWEAEKLGERHYTWPELRVAWLDAKGGKRSISRDEYIIQDFAEFLAPRDITRLREIVSGVLREYGALVKARASESTADRHLACLRSMLRYAVRKLEWLEVCPPITLYNPPKKARIELRPADVAALVAALPERLRDIVLMKVQTGMRYSNVAGLRWDWLTEDGTMALVPAVSAKTKRTYTVPLSSIAREIVQRQRSKLASDCPWVFPNPDTGAPYKTIRFWWEKACDKVGIKCRPHDLRHAFASWHTMNKTPDRVIQEMCGWASPAMLQNYVHLSKSHLASYADNLNK